MTDVSSHAGAAPARVRPGQRVLTVVGVVLVVLGIVMSMLLGTLGWFAVGFGIMTDCTNNYSCTETGCAPCDTTATWINAGGIIQLGLAVAGVALLVRRPELLAPGSPGGGRRRADRGVGGDRGRHHVACGRVVLPARHAGVRGELLRCRLMRSMNMRTAGLTVAAAAVVGLVPACGNVITTDIIGRTAVARGAQGQPVVVVVLCSGEVDEVRLYEGREGLEPDETNPEVATLTSDDAQSGQVEVDLADPEPPWTGSPAPARLSRDMLYIAAASWSGHDAETSQVSFRGRQLATLADDEVLVRSGDVLPRDELDDLACDDAD